MHVTYERTGALYDRAMGPFILHVAVQQMAAAT